MKKILIGLFIQLFISLSVSAQINSAEAIANKIAQKMKDTLSLSEAQKEQVLTINKQLHQQKQAIWQQHNQGDSLITVHIQRIENTRDSLYKAILTDEQFKIYRVKKRKLVNNN